MASLSLYDRISKDYEDLFPVRSDFISLLTALVPAGARVLDVACGPGHYVRELSERYEMSGTDINVSMIETARKQGKASYHTVGFADIAAISGPFDCLYCIGNSLSYLPNDHMTTFLAAAGNILQPGGIMILHTVNWDAFMRTGAMTFEEKTLADGRRFRRAYERVNSDRILFHTWLVNDEETHHWQDSLYPKPSEMIIAGLRQTGFNLESHFGAYDKTPFQADTSPVSIFVARRPAE